MSENRDLKVCINCGHANMPEKISCEQCGVNLLTATDDPLQVVRSETNFVKELLSARFEKRPWVIFFRLFFGLLISFIGGLFLWIVLDPKNVDGSPWIFISGFSIVLFFGLFVLIQTLRRAFSRN